MKRNRRTLRNYFETGRLPSADQFGDLIDSTLNMVDEGFDKTPKNGFEISLIGDHSRLISFFKAGVPLDPVWTIEYDQQRERLLIRRPAKQSSEDSEPAPALTFDAAGRVGVNQPEPAQTLDVGGVIAAEGRIGANRELDGQKTVPADGKWHDIVGPLSGCQAWEVIAGAGNEGTGRYALMRATAINTFNPRGWLFNFLNLKKRIRCQHAYYLSRGNRIKLRWRTGEDGYFLQISSACGYGDGIRIRYYLTRLWFDPDMSESWQAPESGT